MSQFVNVVSFDWWKGDGGSMWGHSSANHKSPHWQIVIYCAKMCGSKLIHLF